MAKLKKYIPFFTILILILAGYATGLIDYLSFEAIKRHRETLRESVENYPYMAPFIYILFYIFITTLALPVDVLLSMIGGFLFPQPLATIYATIGATVGANFLFLATKTAFGNLLKDYAGPHLKKMENGFQQNAVYYLFFLRLIPIFPFWLVNIAPAFLGVAFLTFAWTTAIGTIPAAFAFTEAGSGLGAIFDADKEVTFATILNDEIKLALAVLGLFALVPLFVKVFQLRRTD